MGKRPARVAFGPSEARKRQKLAREPPTSEDVTNSRQLKKLLEFQPDGRNARHGLQSFKLLLDALTTNADHKQELEVLSGYLEDTKPVSESEDAQYVPDIMVMWSYAARTSNEDLMSEVAAVLALLLQATSLSLGLLGHGRGICETLLQEKHLKLIAKNLSADKDRGFVISPAIRLLREIVSYDGGVFARRVFRAQTWTFAEISRNLDIRYRGEGVEEARKPSVRTNAARFLFACFKYLPSENKTELLYQKGIMPAILMRLPDDPPALIHEALDCMMKSVLTDEKIPGHVKARVFWAKPMERLVGLYSYTHDAQDCAVTVADKTHEFLMFACTSPTAGIVSKCNGLYPTSINLDDFSVGGLQWSEMGLEQLSWMDKYADEVPVRNNVLLEVSLTLRPWANLKQGELLVAVLGAAPELVSAYFLGQKSFTFDPKLSMTWIGFASFLFSAMQLPVPEHFGLNEYHTAPPPTPVLLDNIIPLPLTQNALMRCLEPKWPLVSLFASRLLVLALEKLEVVLSMHKEAAESVGKSPWRYAAQKLVNDFCKRIPDMKEIVRWYKSIPGESVLCRATTSRLLLLYYKELPQVALAANFDVSPLLSKALATLDSPFEDPRDRALVLIELENLLEVASLSPGMRWFAKLPGFSGSPFTVLLKLESQEAEGVAPGKLQRILESVATEHQVVLADTGLSPLNRAIAALRKADPKADLEAVWTFLDTCITKCSASPMKYLDLIPDYVGSAHEPGQEINLSLLSVAFAEQLPFATKSVSKSNLDLLTRFILSFTGYSVAAGESLACVKVLLQKMNPDWPAGSDPRLKLFRDAAAGLDNKNSNIASGSALPSRQKSTTGHEKLAGPVMDVVRLEALLHEPFAEPEDNSALTKWVTKSVDDILEDGHAVALIRLLGSEHASIRMEALTNILKLAAKVRVSAHTEKDQIWLLLSELAESAREHVAEGPVPSAFTAFAVHALPVLLAPLHALYPKINKYLTRAPRWPAGKIPMVHDILHEEPSDDDKYYSELTWLFDFLLDCLRREADVGVFHQTRWFEKVFAAACNPYMRPGLRNRVFRVLYRVTCIKGGSTTLVTRFGVLSWLEELRVSEVVGSEERAVVGGLMARVWEACDRGHVGKWSRGGIPEMMGRAVEASA
ncbi:related to URB1 Nucleolar protein required for the normal accumulation of 25S and 5.8S rRNAs [Cephalotrichum gorgonifer]|uniref:Related to URB1 Nucleolar protein required for the normal accumulation of 25S and 5.8S rRNAs n=1 Tax=Cephalotrichum gorgonifer TaxID=2041049 RepID=A0AAE8MTM8_9PEZI|nr:related to URB1 Nucleolar protein required for the normal accumulation of 25S and 5.8S rRNAs [Cephalotrichum gorgonifer]